MLLLLALAGSPPLPAPVTPTLEAGVEAWRAGDTDRAVASLEAWKESTEGPWGRERAAGLFLLGWIHLEQGRDNLASENFSVVRQTRGPLKEMGTWYEALADHRRGRHRVAAGECRAYVKAWPDGRFVADCLLLQGHAWVAEGKRDAALAAYEEFLDEFPDSPREEEARLGIALAHANADPTRGAGMLRELSYEHDYHCTGHQADEALDDLGVSLPPLDHEDHLRAEELRDCGLAKEDAWAAFEVLAADPDHQRWSRDSFERFGWRTNRYEELGDHYAAAYAAKADANTAWLAFSAYRRGGLFERSLEWGRLGLKEHRKHSKWRKQEDVVAHTAQLAGEYVEARALWDEVAAARTGSLGRSARWFGAFSAYRAGDHEDALKRLDRVIAEEDEHELSARYYKAKTLAAMGREEEAQALREALVAEEPDSWYALLVVGQGDRAARWPGPPALGPVEVQGAGFTGGSPTAGLLGREPAGGGAIAGPAWGSEGKAPTPVAGTALLFPEAIELPALAEPDWVVGDPEQQRDRAEAFVRKHEKHCPELPAALDLADVGLYAISGELVADCRQEKGRQIHARAEDWRALFLETHDLHDASRFTYGMPGEELLAWPPAHRDHVQAWAREYDVDPLLVLGLMRAESLYRSKALSHAGAVGVMQIMPSTGSKVAHLLQEPSYTPAVLEQPATNVRYGTWYLSALLTRFEGGWPMAVASYNAGPVNVSSWYRPWRGRIGLDDWVEQIPYKETRGYVKRVSSYYATYVRLYGEGAVAVPAQGGEDRQEVVDF